jgi:single-strand DNA-binding protein
VANLNKVFLMGNLTRDPEVRYTPSGTAVCEFGMAINRRYRSGEEWREETCFVDVSMWGRRGVALSEYLRKGEPVFIEGRLNFRQWENQDGQRRSKLSVVAENFEFLGGRGGGRSRDDDDERGGYRRENRGGGRRGDDRGDDRGPRQAREEGPGRSVGPDPMEEEDVTDKEIPF